MKRRMLIVEDDDELLSLLTIGLASPGWTIETATDAMAGFEKARDIKPFVIVTDYQMPHFGKGSDMLRALRREPVLAKTPVIFLTSMDLPRVQSQIAADDERVRLMSKPPSFKLLRDCIQELTGVNGAIAP